jgi:hypothetical protein
MPNGLQCRGPLRRQNGTLFHRHRHGSQRFAAPTTGLHLADVEWLLVSLSRLADTATRC